MVPVLILDLDEAEAAKLLVSLDPLAAMAEADKVKLDALLREVSTGSEALGLMLGQLAADSNLYQVKGDGKPDGPEEVYQGMPDYEQEDKSGIVIHVHMETEADVAAFEGLLGGKVNRSTNSIPFPYQEPTEQKTFRS